jgi:hypothetical protein
MQHWRPTIKMLLCALRRESPGLSLAGKACGGVLNIGVVTGIYLWQFSVSWFKLWNTGKKMKYIRVECRAFLGFGTIRVRHLGRNDNGWTKPSINFDDSSVEVNRLAAD